MTLKERTALISLVASFSLAVVKLVIGLMIGSLALVALWRWPETAFRDLP